MANTLWTIVSNLHRPVAYMFESLEERSKYKGDGTDLQQFYKDTENRVARERQSSISAFLGKRPALQWIAAILLGAKGLEKGMKWIGSTGPVKAVGNVVNYIIWGGMILAAGGGIVSEFLNRGGGNAEGGGDGGERAVPSEPPRAPQRVAPAPKFSDTP